MLRVWLPQRHILYYCPSSSRRSSGLAVPFLFLHHLSTRSFRFGNKRSTLSASNDESSISTLQTKSKGQKKREALRSVDWAMAFESFSDSQLRRAIRWGDLQEEVYEAVLTVKKIGRYGKNARNRQLKLIGSMLREVDPERMEGIIKAINDGNVEGIFTQRDNVRSDKQGDHLTTNANNDEDYDVKLEVDEEDDYNRESSSSEDERDNVVDDGIVEKWLQGLLSGDGDIVAEVYSMRSAYFNRQELRRLVRATVKTENRIAEEAADKDALERPIGLTEVLDPRAKLRQYLESITGKQTKKT